MAKVQDPETRRLIGRNLASARNLSGLSQSEVMSKIFGSKDPKQKNRISEIESGKTLPDAEILLRLCKLYGTSADYILGFSVEPEFDATAGRVGLLYNGMKEVTADMVQQIAMQLSMASASFLAAMPKPHNIALVEATKKVWREFTAHKSDIPPAMADAIFDMWNITRECDQYIATQMRGYEVRLNDIAARNDKDDKHQILGDIIDRHVQRYPATVLPRNISAVKPLPKKPDDGQLNIFMTTSGECLVQPQDKIEVIDDEDNE